MIGGRLVGIAWAQHHSFDTNIHHLVEESANGVRIGSFEECRVRRGAEAHLDGLADAGHRLLIGAFPADSEVMVVFGTIHVHREGEIFGWREPTFVEFLLEENGIRAEIDVLPPLDKLLDEFADWSIEEWLPSGDRHHGSGALIDGLKGFLEGHVLAEDVNRILDLAAACAGEVAPVERLEHQDERILAAATETLSEDVARHGPHLADWNSHGRE